MPRSEITQISILTLRMRPPYRISLMLSSTVDEPNAVDASTATGDVMNDDNPSGMPSERDNDDDDSATAEPSSIVVDKHGDVKTAAEAPPAEVEPSTIDKPAHDDAMDVDQPETRPGQLEGEQDSAVGIDQPYDAPEGQKNLVQQPAGERVTDDNPEAQICRRLAA